MFPARLPSPYGLGVYCPAPREWCPSLGRCLDPNNPDTPCETTSVPSPYSTTTTGGGTNYIRPESREEVRSDADAADSLARQAQAKLDALGIDGTCRAYETCSVGFGCWYDVSCFYGGYERDAGAIMSSYDVSLVAEARKAGEVVTNFPATSYGDPTGNYEVIEPEIEELEQAPDPLTPAADEGAPPEPAYLGPAPAGAFVGTESIRVPIGGGIDIPQWALLGVAAAGVLMVLRK